LPTNRIRTLLSVLLVVVVGITTGAFAIFHAIHSASSSHVRSVPTVAAGASVVEPTIKDPFSSIRRTAGNTFQVTAAKRPVLLVTVPNLDDDKHEAPAAATAPFFVPDPTVPVDAPHPVEDPVTAPFSTSRRTHAAAGIPNQTKSGPSVQDKLSVATLEETEVEPPPGTTTELALEQLFRIRYLRGSSSTKNADHDHDHQRLLAVARIGQQPTMDKPSKYFNLFWCYLLISILGMSSFVVHTAGNPKDLPDWAGLTRADIDNLTIIQRKELKKKYNDNKGKAKRERSQVASCRDTSFVQKLDPREQHYIAVYFDTIGIDQRYLVNWKKFAQDILQCSNSSPVERFWAEVLLKAFDYACYDPDIYAEWHHLTPLCMFGSVEDARNYIRLPPGWHLKVHFALCFFFPSHIPLAYCVKYMMDKGKEMMESKISSEEFRKYMNDIEFISTQFAKARIRMAEATSKRMQNNHHALNLTNASRKAERWRLAMQRKELRASGAAELFGEYTKFEVELYCLRWSDLVGLLKFNHFPRTRKERDLERNEQYEDMEQLKLQDKDIVIAKGRYVSRTNDYFKNVVSRNFADYEAATITNRPGGSKQLLKNRIVNELMEEGYRFVIAYKPNCEHLNRDQKKKAPNSYVQASFEGATLKVDNAIAYLRYPKVKNPATKVIAKGKENIATHFAFKKRKPSPNNDEASDNRKPPAIPK